MCENPETTSLASEKVRRLQEYILGLMSDEDKSELYKRYRDLFPVLEPVDVFGAFSDLMADGIPPQKFLGVLNKVIKVLSVYLPSYSIDNARPQGFIYELMNENEKYIKILERYKGLFATGNNRDKPKILNDLADELEDYELHLLKKENILFPSMEKKSPVYDGFAIMWALHDDFRTCMRELRSKTGSLETTGEELNRILGNLYFLVYGLIEKENLLMFPAAAKILSDEELQDMQSQKTDHGELTPEQMMLILDSLPVDISYVDENNILKFFNSPDKRIFHRSSASIGRNVRNCHPPKSYAAVEKIIEDFRSGAKNSTSFWIELKGRLILIEYYAIRDSLGNYRGVLEASRDITDIKKLEGEKRL